MEKSPKQRVRDITPFEWEGMLGCLGWGVDDQPPLVGDIAPGGPNDPQEVMLIGGSEVIGITLWRDDEPREWGLEGYTQGNRVVCRHLMEGVLADLDTTPLDEVLQKWGFVEVSGGLDLLP